MNSACAVCQLLWEEYSRLADQRLALIREQRQAFTAGATRHAVPLGLRILRLGEEQIGVRKRLAAHESESHRPGACAAPQRAAAGAG